MGLGLSYSTMAEDDGQRYVNQVMWDKSGETAVERINNSQIPAYQSNLVFIRMPDTNDVQTSVNIGVDGRFQTSLQGGHYSQVRTCVGNHRVSLTQTGKKSNDLDLSSKTLDTLSGTTHYFRVELEENTGSLRLTEIDQASANYLLNGLTEQTHQISRVQAKNCEMPQPVTAVEPSAPKKMFVPLKVEPIAPTEMAPTKSVLNQPVSLDVLFDFDSSVVPPIYNQRIQEVANLMKSYPYVTAMIEGHTDSKGAASYNMQLSMRRAQAVKYELVNRYGADANRIYTTGFGETRPIDTNATPEGRQNNRRVIAIISDNNNR